MPPLSPALIQSIQNIRLLVLDIDGVFTDGRITLGDAGEEFNTFHTQDGQGIKLLHLAGILVAVISGRQSLAAKNRMQELGITHIYQGISDKLATLQEFIKNNHISLEETAYIGDDLQDLPCIRAVGLGVTVPNGVALVKQHADLQTTQAGGHGAVRELCDLILTHQKKWNALCEKF
jgi:3-deoxy-D-manno-octulosonate 8-phosphate phosphatase (KDO 8-P phosphatase)